MAWDEPWLFEEACACMRSHTHTQKLSPVCVCVHGRLDDMPRVCVGAPSVKERENEEQGRPLLKMETVVPRIRGVSVHSCPTRQILNREDTGTVTHHRATIPTMAAVRPFWHGRVLSI